MGNDSVESAEIKRLQRAIQFKTVSYSDDIDTNSYFEEPNELVKFHQYLRQEFPHVFSTSSNVSVEVINKGSFLIHVRCDLNQSSDDPFLMIAHMDVVPTNDEKWTVPPFEGIIKDGFVYGRGAIDDKAAVLAILEALNNLLSDQSFKCSRDFFIALTHDEEVGGANGAKKVAPRLQQILNGKDLEFILDEGLIILEDFRSSFPPVALIGICEKGHLDMKLSTKTHAGHSSIPPTTTAVTTMCEAILKVNNCKFPMHLKDTPMHQTLLALAPHFQLTQRSMLYSIKTSDYLVKTFLSRDPITAVLMQTTKVCTLISGGTARNVVPSECSANINCRLHPKDSAEDIVAITKNAVGDEVSVEIVKTAPAPKCSSTNSRAYKALESCIKTTFPESNLVVAPGLLTGQTDSRHFQHLTKDIYRFNPYWMKRSDVDRIHGHDERVSIENYLLQIEFFKNFLKSCAFTQIE